MVSQINVPNLLKRCGTLCHYPCPDSQDEVAIVAFADANHSVDGCQLCYLIGILYGEVTEGSVFLLLSWASHKIRRPVESMPAAKILAAAVQGHPPSTPLVEWADSRI